MSTDLEVYEGDSAPVTLFGTNDPKLTIERMSECASALVDVVKDRRLAVRINGKEHLTVEAWTTLGAMVGVYAVVQWTRQNEAEDGYLARAVAQTLDGRTVGAAGREAGRSRTYVRMARSRLRGDR